jgi:CO dehydrogenase maturation factor
MRIAFVGKGGSGKTTLSALFSKHVAGTKKPVLVFDADLNIHLPELFGFKESVSPDMYISKLETRATIKKHLIGSNSNIKEIVDLGKTTLPSEGSNLIDIHNLDKSILKDYSVKEDNLHLVVVGTYEDDRIGKSCYHGNLVIFENILNHLVDKDGYVVTDMVAGVDAFANTLHAQFDVLALIVEPTKRSIEVFEHYNHLAKEGGVHKNLFIIANKIRNESDKDFILNHIPERQFIGFFNESEYLREIERTSSPLEISKLEPENIKLLNMIKDTLEVNAEDTEDRFDRIQRLHDRIAL